MINQILELLDNLVLSTKVTMTLGRLSRADTLVTGPPSFALTMG